MKGGEERERRKGRGRGGRGEREGGKDGMGKEGGRE